MQTIPDTIDWTKFLEQPVETAQVRPASEYVDRVVDRFYGEGRNTGSIALPWSRLHGLFELRPSEVTIWAGVNGSGKSMLLNQIMLHAMQQGAKVCLASLEMAPVRTLERMMRQAAGERDPAIRFIRAFGDWSDGKLWMFDHMGVAKHATMLGVMRYCAEEHGIEHFVLDNLGKCGIGTDDYNKQKDFIDQLCAWARDNRAHCHLVHHARKGQKEGDQLDKWDIRGAGEITDQVDNAVLIWRNKPKEAKLAEDEFDEEARKQPDCVLNLCKQRHGEWEGKTGLWYDHASMQYRSVISARPIRLDCETPA